MKAQKTAKEGKAIARLAEPMKATAKISRHVFKGIIAGFLGVFCVITLVFPLTGCSKHEADQSGDYVTRVASLKGPTTVGLLNMMEKANNNEFPEKYEFSIEASADVISQKILAGQLDVALIPANVASTLYNKSNGQVRALDICAGSVLDIVAPTGCVKNFADLSGKTLYTMGKGTSPEFVLNYLLQKAGLTDKVNVQYKQEASEVIQALADDKAAAALLPQPFATVAPSKVPGTEIALDMEKAWSEYALAGSNLVCGVTVLRQDYLADHEKLAEEFVRHQDDSVKKATNNIGDTARLMVKYGILDNEELAKKAIPYCGLSCTRNQAMRKALGGYLAVLAEEDTASIGGKVPDDHFYISETF